VEGLAAGDGFSGVQREASGEHREPAEQDALVPGQEPVAPVDRAPQRLLARHRRAGTASEQPETVVEAVEDLLDAQQPAAGGGQFYGERDPVESLADGGEHRRRLVRDSEVRSRLAGAVDEQANGLVLPEGVDAAERAALG